ncbi:MAG: ornithine cyclodeaminase family protein [Deltaproteobacteria bacterium]|nr:ornithine cyclodeaminase family protein [Deltaproteobacteria bacterium]
MATEKILYLSQADVTAVNLPMSEIIHALETAFREKGAGRTEMPPKPGIHPGGGDNFIHAMPAYIPSLKSAGIKWVAGFTENFKRGLPYITGLLILNDVETGFPLAVMDCVWITAMRTGAATALSARYLARPESSTVGILGCGPQGRTNLEALNVLFSVKKVMAYDIDPDISRRYASEMSKRFDLDVFSVLTPGEAVKGCDIVVSAGPILRKPHRTIRKGWLDEGAFASLVDFDTYWHPDAMKETGKFCTDDIAQLLHYKKIGYFQDIPPLHADLGEMVSGKKGGRENAREKTMTANLGLAIEDMAVAPRIYERALDMGVGTRLPL